RDRRSKSDERWRERRGMNNHALVPLREHGVVTVLAVEGETFLAAFEQANDVLVAEVPAAVAPAEVAAERAHIADLRAANNAGGSCQCGEKLAQLLMSGDVGQLGRGADTILAARPLDAGQRGDTT